MHVARAVVGQPEMGVGAARRMGRMYLGACGLSGWPVRLIAGGRRTGGYYEGKNKSEDECLCKANDTFSLLADEASRALRQAADR